MSQKNNDLIQRFTSFMESVTPKDATSVEEIEKENLHTDENKGEIGSEPAAEQAGSTNQKVKNPRKAQSRVEGSDGSVSHGDAEESVKGDFKKVTERKSESTETTEESSKSGEEKMASDRQRLGVLEGNIRKSLVERTRQAPKGRKKTASGRSGDPVLDKVASDLRQEMNQQYRFLLPIRQTCARDIALMKQAGVDERLARKAGGWENLWAKLASENPDEMLPPEAAEAVKAEQAEEVPAEAPVPAPEEGAEEVPEVTEEDIQELSTYLEEAGASEEDVMQAIELIERLKEQGLSYQEILELSLQAGEEAAAELGGGEAVPPEEGEEGGTPAPETEEAPAAEDEDIIDVPLP